MKRVVRWHLSAVVEWLSLLCIFIQQSVNSCLLQVQILLTVGWMFTMVRTSEYDLHWSNKLTSFRRSTVPQKQFFFFIIISKVTYTEMHSSPKLKTLLFLKLQLEFWDQICGAHTILGKIQNLGVLEFSEQNVLVFHCRKILYFHFTYIFSLVLIYCNH